MFDNSFSYIKEDKFMTCRMLFVVTEEYCQFSMGKKVWEVLDIRNDTWSHYKRMRELPLKHYKSLCNAVGCGFTDDDKEICSSIFEKYFSEKEEQYED